MRARQYPGRMGESDCAAGHGRARVDPRHSRVCAGHHPQPWNTPAGQTFLQTELVEFARTWIELSTRATASVAASKLGPAGFAAELVTLSPATVQRLFAILNALILKTAHQHASAHIADTARTALDLLKLYY